MSRLIGFVTTNLRRVLMRSWSKIMTRSITLEVMRSKLQETCFEAIKVAELEISGIRDGDSDWGGDVLMGYGAIYEVSLISWTTPTKAPSRRLEKRNAWKKCSAS
jgi:hypothetical protein